MQYMLLIYSTENDGPDDPDMLDRYRVFGEEVREAGKFVAAGRLQPISTASSVRVRDGELDVTDGPFAETKEQLGGYYLLDCDDLDEAIAYARKIPAAEHGAIEVRPVWEVPVPA
jgi:hypothetical protein